MLQTIVSRESDELWQSGSRWCLAAVLVILYRDKSAPGVVRVVLTVRGRQLRRHAGDPAFPGGLAEPGEDWWTTALREASEEIGFNPEAVPGGVSRLAALPMYRSLHNLLVRPCVVQCHSPTTLKTLAPALHHVEVECAFSLPLEKMLDANSLAPGSSELVNRTGFQQYYYRFIVDNADWLFTANTPSPPCGSHYTATIHGLTAHILVDVARWFCGRAPDFPYLAEYGWHQGVRLCLNEKEPQK